jgi:hypothetical protein
MYYEDVRPESYDQEMRAYWMLRWEHNNSPGATRRVMLGVRCEHTAVGCGRIVGRIFSAWLRGRQFILR